MARQMRLFSSRRSRSGSLVDQANDDLRLCGKILRLLRTVPDDGWTADELAAELGTKRALVRRALSELLSCDQVGKSDQWVRRTARGGSAVIWVVR